MTIRSTFVLATALTGLALTGCQTKPAEPIAMENLETISATVTAIDMKKRIVSLMGPEGRTATIEVPADVRNLAQVKVGDKLVVRYYESLEAAVVPKGTSASTWPTQDAGVARADKGAKPGAAVGSLTTATVVVQSVDKKTHTVTFAGADGIVRNRQVKDPAAQKFVDTLKKGDEVSLAYSEALAVSVEAAK